MELNLKAIINELASPSQSRRAKAILALLRSESDKAIPLLEKTASRDPSVEIRYLAKKALFHLKQKARDAAPALAGPQRAGTALKVNLQALEYYLSSQDEKNRMKVVSAAIRYNDPEILPVLVKHLKDEKDPLVRGNIIRAIGILGDSRYVAVLFQYLEDPDPRVRANAIEALGEIGDPTTYPYIVKYLSDEDNRIRANCARVLKNFGAVNIRRVLEEMLSSQAVWMRDSAAYALALIASDNLIDLIKIAARDTSKSVREKARAAFARLAEKGNAEAARALSEMKSEEFGQSILEIVTLVEDEEPVKTFSLDDPDYRNRISAIKAILEKKDRKDVELLAGRLEKEQEGYVRSMLIHAIGELGGSDYIGYIARSLNDHDVRVRANAIETLALMKDPRIIPLLEPYLLDSNNRVRANAIIALSQFPDVDISQALESMVNSSESLMKRSAIYAIYAIRRPEHFSSLVRFLSDSDPDVVEKALETLYLLRDEGVAEAGEVITSWHYSVMENLPAPLIAGWAEVASPPADPEKLQSYARYVVEFLFAIYSSCYLESPFSIADLNRRLKKMHTESSLAGALNLFIDNLSNFREELFVPELGLISPRVFQLLSELAGQMSSSSGEGALLSVEEKLMRMEVVLSCIRLADRYLFMVPFVSRENRIEAGMASTCGELKPLETPVSFQGPAPAPGRVYLYSKVRKQLLGLPLLEFDGTYFRTRIPDSTEEFLRWLDEHSFSVESIQKLTVVERSTDFSDILSAHPGALFVRPRKFFESFEEITKKHEKGIIILAGPPGSGKTALACELARSEKAVVYWGRGSREFADIESRKRLMQVIYQQSAEKFSLKTRVLSLMDFEHPDKDAFREFLSSAVFSTGIDRFTIVIDGIEDVWPLEFLGNILPPRAFTVFMTYPGVRWTGEALAHLELSGLDEEEMFEFVERLLPGSIANEREKNSIVSLARGNPGLARLLAGHISEGGCFDRELECKLIDYADRLIYSGADERERERRSSLVFALANSPRRLTWLELRKLLGDYDSFRTLFFMRRFMTGERRFRFFNETLEKIILTEFVEAETASEMRARMEECGRWTSESVRNLF